MNQTVENQEIEKLIKIINHVSLNENDLLDASLEFVALFFKYNLREKEQFELLFDKPEFTQKVCIVAREGVVLGMQAITLKEEISFLKVIKACLDINKLTSNQSDITLCLKTQNLINHFFVFLRKQLFVNMYTQNKELQQFSGITNNILKERKKILFDYPFNELL